jgi:DNA-damage-inducible protein J
MRLNIGSFILTLNPSKRDTIAVHLEKWSDFMAKTSTITIRLDPKVKTDAQVVFDKLGLTTTQAISLFLNQVSLNKGLPFDLHIPNAETAKAIEDALAGRNLHRANKADDLFAGLKS